jgi:hypothetical protein
VAGDLADGGAHDVAGRRERAEQARVLLVAGQDLIARAEVHAHHDLAHPFGRAGRQRDVGRVRSERPRVRRAQGLRELRATFEMGQRAPLGELAVELGARGLDGAARQRPVGAGVEVRALGEHGELAAQSGRIHDRRE